MLRIFLTAIYIFVQMPVPVFAQEKTPKIDVESLGLDNVDQKITEKNPEEIKPVESMIIEKKPEEAVSPDNGIVKKIQHFFNKDAAPPSFQKEETKKITTEKSPTEQHINSAKKRNLKKRLQLEKQKKINEKKQQEKLKKLNELRQKYLIKITEDESSNIAEDEEKIIPRKKEISRFLSDETPPLPILDPLRSADNLHIPNVFTPTENVMILFDSISNGDVAFFNSAYKNVENPNIKNQFGDTILTAALLQQKHAIVASALSNGANPNMPNELGYTPIDIAIELLDIKSLELLIENNADVKYVDAFGRTYLMHAARVGFLPAVSLFVAKAVDINAMDDDGFTALSIAYRHKKEVIVKFLLKNGAKTWLEKPYNPEEQSLIRELENRWK